MRAIYGIQYRVGFVNVLSRQRKKANCEAENKSRKDCGKLPVVATSPTPDKK